MKYEHFIIDIESVGLHNYPVILSIALIPFNLTDNPCTIEDLENYKKNGIFVKLDAKDQVDRLGFNANPDTVEWWKRQPKESQKISLFKTPHDIKIEDGWQKILNFVVENRKSKDVLFWSRGCFEPQNLDPMAERLGMPLIHFGHYNQWAEVRTALRILYGSDKDSAQWNYGVEIDFPNWHELFKNGYFIKHDPLSDCLLDLVFLLKGKPLN